MHAPYNHNWNGVCPNRGVFGLAGTGTDGADLVAIEPANIVSAAQARSAMRGILTSSDCCPHHTLNPAFTVQMKEGRLVARLWCRDSSFRLTSLFPDHP